MTVGQEIYGSGNPGSRTSLERKNVPPPLSFKFPSLTLQQHHQNNLQSPLNTIPFPKSAPAQTNNNDIMQFHLQMMLQNEAKTPGPTLKSQFSSPNPSSFHYGNPISTVQSHGSPESQNPLSQQQQQQQQQNPEKNSANRYKTELCRPFEESGCCKYGDKCQFAHGIQELRDLSRHPKYKTEQCRTFHTIGFCPYGPRCHFIHNSEEKRAPPISPGPHNPGSHATLQNLPALLALLQQTSLNKLLNSFNKLQLGITNEQDFYQLLNGQQNILSPPSTPNMFSFHEYMLPAAAQALNQAARSTSNIHSYINFNIALKDQNLSNIIDAAQLTPLANHHIGYMYPPNNNTPPNMSPTGTPPLSNESSPMSERNMDTSYPMTSLSAMMHGSALPQQHTPHQQPHPHHSSQQHLTHLYTSPSSTLEFQYYRQLENKAMPGSEMLTPGRIISEVPSSPTVAGASGKRLPIFNQISDKKHVVF